MIHDIVHAPPDYNVGLNLGYLTRSPREILHRVTPDGIFKLVRLKETSVLVQILTGNGEFIVAYPLAVPEKAIRDAVKRFISEWFDLETDLSPFYEMASRDRLLKKVVAKYHGYRIVGIPDLFESLCWAIIGQQINLPFAYTLKQRFVENFGSQIEYNGERYYAFPAPGAIAALSDHDLLPLQFSRQKSMYVRLVAEAFESGTISRDLISQLPFAEARQKLMSIKGVGNWTANYALMKTFRYPNAFPLEDAGLHNAIRNLKKLELKPSAEEVKRIFRKYAGWEAYATLYLWKTLENIE